MAQKCALKTTLSKELLFTGSFLNASRVLNVFCITSVMPSILFYMANIFRTTSYRKKIKTDHTFLTLYLTDDEKMVTMALENKMLHWILNRVFAFSL